MSPDTYPWIVAVVAPISSVIIASVFLYGALFSRFRIAFGLIGLAGGFFLISQLYWLALRLQQDLGISLLPRDTFRLLFPVQAVCLYIGLAVALAGDVILVWQASKQHGTPHT